MSTAAAWSRALVLLALVVAVSPASAQVPPADPELAAEAEQSAPVVISGEVIIWIPTGAGQYTPEVRARAIATRLEEAIADRSLSNPTVTVVEVEGSSEVRVGPRLLMVVTARDALRLGAPRSTLAQFVAQEFEKTIRNERLRRAPGALDPLRFLRAGSDLRICDPGVGDRAIDAMVPPPRRTLACRAPRGGTRPGCGDRVVGSNRRRHR